MSTLLEYLTRVIIRRKGELRWASTGRAITDRHLTELYITAAPIAQSEGVKMPPIRDIMGWLDDILPKVESSPDSFVYPTVNGHDEWVFAFYARHNIDIGYDSQYPARKVAPQTDKISWDAKEWEKIALAELCNYNDESAQWDVEQNKKVIKRTTYSKDAIKDIMAGLPAKLELERFHATRVALSYTPDKAPLADKLLTVFLESVGAYTELNLAVMKNWMWQVKQYVYGRKVDEPLFINIYSSQGTGKTTFLRGLYSPLGVYSYEPKLDAIKSEGYAKLWSSKYIILFDEIRVDSIDRQNMFAVMSNLKYMLTMDMNMYRMFHTQDTAEKRRIFSAISTSNQPLTDSLYDPTGMRRFYEISCEATSDNKAYMRLPHIFDRDEIKAEKSYRIFQAAWCGIDENLAAGYLTPELREELRKIQDSYRKMDCIELYELYRDDSDDPFVKAGDSVVEELLIPCLLAAKKRSEVFDLSRKKGFAAKCVRDYRQEIVEWMQEDGGSSMQVYGAQKMARMLESHGFFVGYYRAMPFIFQKLDVSGGFV